MQAYDQIADWYTSARNPEVGTPELESFARRLPPGARVLDIGCGDGVPISQFLTRAGAEVVGLDSSPEMVARFRANLPSVPVRCERVQDASFEAESFGGVVAWGVLFHLSAPDQRAVIETVAEWLMPGGRALFTSGGEEGATEGEMDGVTFRYVSLGAEQYRAVLDRAGLVLETVHPDAWDNHVYVARKPIAADL